GTRGPAAARRQGRSARRAGRAPARRTDVSSFPCCSKGSTSHVTGLGALAARAIGCAAVVYGAVAAVLAFVFFSALAGLSVALSGVFSVLAAAGAAAMTSFIRLPSRYSATGCDLA